jgi:hypothetical protein
MDKRDELIVKLEELIKLWENLSIMNGSIGYIAGLNKIDELQLIISTLKDEIEKENISDADIEAWAEDYAGREDSNRQKFIDEEAFDGFVEGAKSMRDGLIKKK